VSVIEVKDLYKSYGDIEALKTVSLKVEPGQIYGLLGQNGAGKSTMVKILLGIVRKTGGDAFLLGYPAGTTEIRKKVGYLPEDHAFPGYHTGESLLDFYGQLYGMSRPDRIKRIAESLDIVGLRKRGTSKIKTYSKGMKQRLGIAQAFFHDPEVIFLDEPSDGVDPVGRKEIRDLLGTLKGEGRTIFVNSHLLGEVEMISDRVAIMHKGELVRQGTVAELTRQTDRYTIGLAGGQQVPVEDLKSLGFIVDVVGTQVEVEVPTGGSIDAALELLSKKGLRLRHLVEKKSTLEDVFIKLVEDSERGGSDRRGVRVARPISTARRA
jgi:ABC-2 type transport system ATP-binding protein